MRAQCPGSITTKCQTTSQLPWTSRPTTSNGITTRTIPKARLGFSSRAPLCFPGGLHPTELGRCTPREGLRLGAATAVALWESFATFIPSSFRQRADNERASDGGMDATHMCTGSAPPSPPPTPKARLGFSSRAAFVLPGRLTPYGAGPVHPQGGPPSRSSDSGRSLGALCHLYTIIIQAKGGQRASE